MGFALVLLAIGFPYAIWASIIAFRESGQKWMLFLHHWIDASSGVSKTVRIHGMIAFAILFVGGGLFIYG